MCTGPPLRYRLRNTSLGLLLLTLLGVTRCWGAGTPPVITVQPASQRFPLFVSGTAPFAYQWSFNGTDMSDATNAALSLTNVQTNDAGSYQVVVTNSYGSITSSVATLTVYVPPSIATQPQSLTVTQGQSASFSVVASGSAPLTYQWYLNGACLGAGDTNATLSLSNVGANNAGNYTDR